MDGTLWHLFGSGETNISLLSECQFAFRVSCTTPCIIMLYVCIQRLGAARTCPCLASEWRSLPLSLNRTTYLTSSTLRPLTRYSMISQTRSSTSSPPSRLGNSLLVYFGVSRGPRRLGHIRVLWCVPGVHHCMTFKFAWGYPRSKPSSKVLTTFLFFKYFVLTKA